MARPANSEISYYSRLLYYNGYLSIKDDECDKKYENDITPLVRLLDKKQITLEDVLELGCLFSTYIFTNNKVLIKRLITNKKSIGQGQYGSVDSARMKNLYFVIKTNEDPKDVYREAYIGSLVNKIIEKYRISQFMYMIGALPNINTLVFEYVSGDPLEKWNVRVSLEEKEKHILTIILQVICALCIAQKEIQFIHNDLNDRNVIIYPLKEKHSFPFTLGGNIYTVKNCTYLARIIDYGLSAGYKDYEKVNNISRNEILNSPRYDICRLIYGFFGKDCDEFAKSLMYATIYGIFSKDDGEIFHTASKYTHYLNIAEKRPNTDRYEKVLSDIITGENVNSEKPKMFERYEKYLNEVLEVKTK